MNDKKQLRIVPLCRCWQKSRTKVGQWTRSVAKARHDSHATTRHADTSGPDSATQDVTHTVMETTREEEHAAPGDRNSVSAIDREESGTVNATNGIEESPSSSSSSSSSSDPPQMTAETETVVEVGRLKRNARAHNLSQVIPRSQNAADSSSKNKSSLLRFTWAMKLAQSVGNYGNKESRAASARNDGNGERLSESHRQPQFLQSRSTENATGQAKKAWWSTIFRTQNTNATGLPQKASRSITVRTQNANATGQPQKGSLSITIDTQNANTTGQSQKASGSSGGSMQNATGQPKKESQSITVRTKNANATGQPKNKASRTSGVSRSDVALIRSLVLVFVLLVLLYIPISVAVALLGSVPIPPEVFSLCLLAFFLNQSINWIVYGVLNRNFRHGYKQLLWVRCCCRNHR